MMHVRVEGVWLRSIGTWSDLSVSHAWPHGSEQASWTMEPGIRHPALHRGALVEVFDGGICIFRGKLGDRAGANGEFSAQGLYAEAEGILAQDGSGLASNTPDTAIDAAIARGAVSWTRPASLSAVSWGTAGEAMDLAELLDKSMAGLGKRWYVDTAGAVQAAVDPTTPAYVVPQAAVGEGLALADDAYYSHLTGTYLTALAPDTYAAVTVGDAAAAARWGRREAVVDLTPMKVISSGTATAEVTARLAQTGARMGFAESLNLGYGQITTTGGTPVSLTTPRAGEMVRLMGVTDETRSTASLPYIDIVIGRSSYKDGDATVQLSPVGLAPRDLGSIMRVVAAEVA